MAAKKKVSDKKLEEAGFVLGYDWRWMKKHAEEHPDYEKVMKEVKKRGLDE